MLILIQVGVITQQFQHPSRRAQTVEDVMVELAGGLDHLPDDTVEPAGPVERIRAGRWRHLLHARTLFP
jgi:hypothetical protein